VEFVNSIARGFTREGTYWTVWDGPKGPRVETRFLKDGMAYLDEADTFWRGDRHQGRPAVLPHPGRSLGQGVMTAGRDGCQGAALLAGALQDRPGAGPLKGCGKFESLIPSVLAH
jgi:hypothetical protein